MTQKPISIMIVDDHVVIRSGLRMLIEHDQRMRVVAQAGNRTEALERAESERPDVIILDLVLGDERGDEGPFSGEPISSERCNPQFDRPAHPSGEGRQGGDAQEVTLTVQLSTGESHAHFDRR